MRCLFSILFFIVVASFCYQRQWHALAMACLGMAIIFLVAEGCGAAASYIRLRLASRFGPEKRINPFPGTTQQFAKYYVRNRARIVEQLFGPLVCHADDIVLIEYIRATAASPFTEDPYNKKALMFLAAASENLIHFSEAMHASIN